MWNHDQNIVTVQTYRQIKETDMHTPITGSWQAVDRQVQTYAYRHLSFCLSALSDMHTKHLVLLVQPVHRGSDNTSTYYPQVYLKLMKMLQEKNSSPDAAVPHWATISLHKSFTVRHVSASGMIHYWVLCASLVTIPALQLQPRSSKCYLSILFICYLWTIHGLRCYACLKLSFCTVHVHLYCIFKVSALFLLVLS